jgi:hypothetical protein
VRHILNKLSPAERKRVKEVVVLGAPKNPKSLYKGSWDLVYRPDPPTGHMDGPKALLAELGPEKKEEQVNADQDHKTAGSTGAALSDS